jgi:hypothetical protein
LLLLAQDLVPTNLAQIGIERLAARGSVGGRS